MAKSNYPSKLDTSKEVPAVRDDILEIGSEAINSIRSALFNIERALGINPQGASGNTVANRLNAALDGNGKIRKEALALANVLSGPITNTDVSSVAAIAESKLRLTFPTQVLQDEISIVSGELDILGEQIKNVSALLSAHTNSSAINRHAATAISADPTTAIGSDEGILDIEATDVQQAFEDIHDRHINYTGADISSSNNSHLANQIYFNDAEVSGLLSSDDVQEAIEETALLTSTQTILHQDRHHSNGYLRNGSLKDATNDEIGLIFAEDVGASFSASDGESDGLTKVTFNDPIEIESFTPKKGDLLIIKDTADTDELYVGTYYIAIINLSDDEEDVESVEVYGLLHGSNVSTTLFTVAKNPQRPQNAPGMLLGIREKATLTSATSMQVANPDSCAIVSSGVKPSEITSTNRFITLSVDGSSTTTLDLYDASSTTQSVDSIVKKINEQAVEGNFKFLAYRLELRDGGVEFAIVHNLPDTTDNQRTLMIGEGSDGALTTAGLSHLKDLDISAEVGSLYFIKGLPLSGLREKLNTTGLSYFAGTTSITIGSASVDFLKAGIKNGDLITISGAEEGTDDGSFVISDVTSTSLVIDTDQIPSGFAGSPGDDAVFEIYENIINLDDTVFDAVAGSIGATMMEVFIDENQNLFSNKRLEYGVEISGIDALISISDYEGPFAKDETLTLTIEDINSIVNISLDGGTKQRAIGSDSYIWIESGTDNRRLRVYIPNAATLLSKIVANGTITTTVYAFDGINEDSVLMLGRVPFGNYRGRIVGGVDPDNPRVFSPVQRGSVGWDDLRTDAIHKGTERPINELRSDGVTYGLQVTSPVINDGLYSITVGSGTCYVRGRRFEIPSTVTIETDIESATVDKFYVAINSEGEILAEPAEASTCDNPFADDDSVILATVEYDQTTVRVYDLRLFISDLDLTLLNSITVSPDYRLAHFDSVTQALKYAERFSDMFPLAGTPTIHLKSGTHEVTVKKDESTRTYDEWETDFVADPDVIYDSLYTAVYDQGLLIDFPVTITGEGDGTILKIRTEYTFSDQVASFRGIIFIPGDKFATITAPNSTFSSGFIKLSDFRMDNCRVSCVDLNVEDDTGTPFTFGVEIKNVTFDFDAAFTTVNLDDLIGRRGVSITELDDKTTNKGNIVIDNCKFIDSYVIFTTASRIQNFRFSNNVLYSNDTGYLLHNNVVSFDDANDGSNIEVYGNYIADNHEVSDSATAPTLVQSIDGISARTESNQYIGGFVESTDFIKADLYKYNTARNAIKYAHVDQLPDVAMGEPTPGSAFSTFNNGSREVKTILLDGTNTTDFVQMRLPDILNGQTLTQLAIHFYSEIIAGSGEFGNHDYEIFSEDLDLTQSSEASSSANPMTIGIHPNGALGFNVVDLSGLSISGSDYKYFYIKFNRQAVSSFKEHVAYISYVVETTTVEGIGGFD